jgi:hypothetical protein
MGGKLRKEAIQIAARQAGSRGVMDQDPVVTARAARQGSQGIADRMASLLSAGGHEDGGRSHLCPIRVILGECRDGAGASSVGHEGSQSPFDNHPSGKGCVLLWAVGAETAAYSSSGHHQPISHPRSLYDAARGGFVLLSAVLARTDYRTQRANHDYDYIITLSTRHHREANLNGHSWRITLLPRSLRNIRTGIGTCTKTKIGASLVYPSQPK